MALTLEKQASEVVYSGFQAAALDLGLDMYEADQFFNSVREEAHEEMIRGYRYRLDVLLIKEGALSQRALEVRSARHKFHCKQALEISGLSDGMARLLKRYLLEEADFELECWSERQPVSHQSPNVVAPFLLDEQKVPRPLWV